MHKVHKMHRLGPEVQTGFRGGAECWGKQGLLHLLHALHGDLVLSPAWILWHPRRWSGWLVWCGGPRFGHFGLGWGGKKTHSWAWIQGLCAFSLLPRVQALPYDRGRVWNDQQVTFARFGHLQILFRHRGYVQCFDWSRSMIWLSSLNFADYTSTIDDANTWNASNGFALSSMDKTSICEEKHTTHWFVFIDMHPSWSVPICGGCLRRIRFLCVAEEWPGGFADFRRKT